MVVILVWVGCIMAGGFPRLHRGLARDGFGRSLGLLALVTVLLGAWIGWALFVSVPVHATGRARIERTIHPVQAQVAGRLVVAHPELGQRVRKGQVLFRLDAQPQTLELREAERRRQAVVTEREALRGVIEAAESTLSATRKARARALREAQARGSEAEAAARLAEAEADQVEALAEHMAELERIRSESRAHQRRSAAEASQHAISRLQWEYLESEKERRTFLADQRRDLTRLEGSLGTLQARIEQLQQQIEMRTIRAPETGTVAEVAGLEPGVMIETGERLAVIVSRTELQAMAKFDPAEAVGRIRPGQRAHLRLDGFPWTQFGVVPARVDRVASEVTEGKIRVELTLQPAPDSAIPLQHGLEGNAEVAVESVSPFTLLLRAAGRLIGERPQTLRHALGTG